MSYWQNAWGVRNKMRYEMIQARRAAVSLGFSETSRIISPQPLLSSSCFYFLVHLGSLRIHYKALRANSRDKLITQQSPSSKEAFNSEPGSTVSGRAKNIPVTDRIFVTFADFFYCFENGMWWFFMKLWLLLLCRWPWCFEETELHHEGGSRLQGQDPL